VHILGNKRAKRDTYFSEELFMLFSGWLNWVRINTEVNGKRKCVDYVGRLLWPIGALSTSVNRPEDGGRVFFRNIGTKLRSCVL